MSYSDANLTSFHFGVTDLTVARTFAIPMSKGKKGRIRDVFFSATTATAGGTTTPRVQVGVAGNLTKFCDADVGVLAAGRGVAASRISGALKDDKTGAVPPGDTEQEILVTTVPPTGAGAAGGGLITVRVDLF